MKARLEGTIAIIGFVAGMALTTPAARASTSYYQQFGGESGMHSLVNDFVNRVTSDPRIDFYFAHTNIPALKAALATQFCMLEGGGCKFDMSMKSVHQGLNITQAAFNALANDLNITMDEHDIPVAAQNNLLAKLAAMESQVVTK